jgi:hypothetical protein
MEKFTISLQENDIDYKISKILFYGNNGGFGVLCPYHSAKSGYLLKYTTGLDIYAEYSQETNIKVDEHLQYSASDRIKLSIHTDGFVQFSGENPQKIISGRDKITGEPKGLGLFSSPLSKPILSGPTFAITIWGLKEFSKYDGSKVNESAIQFLDQDYEYRETNKENYNAYIIEGFVFPPMFWNFSFLDNFNRQIVKFRHPEFQHERNRPLTFRVLPFIDTELRYMVAILVSRAQLQMTEHHNSGFVFASPSQVKDGKVTAMQAIFPEFEYDTKKVVSLNY